MFKDRLKNSWKPDKMVNVIPNNSLQSDLYTIVGFNMWGIRVGKAGQVERKVSGLEKDI